VAWELFSLATVEPGRNSPKRLALQLDLEACPTQFARFQLELKDAELKDASRRTGRLHDRSPGVLTLLTGMAIQ
jgi:hypothetical protein